MRDGDDGSSSPNTGGFVESVTTEGPGERRWAEERRGVRARDGLQRWSKQ